jgi:RimJ/RimL family protein N-acetyltransferase
VLRAWAATTGEPLLAVGGRWFDAYLRVLLGPLLGIYSRYGLALEAHQQNILLELDEVGWPVKVFFRDNQGYFFREGKAAELAAYVPGFGEGCYLVHTEEHINPKYAYYLLLNNLLGLIASLGRQGLATEDDLLARTAACLEAQRATDETGLVAYLLDATFWETKGNLRMSLTNMNEATQPVEAPAIYLPYPNPFIRARHHAPALLSPVPGGPVVASRRVAEYGGATLALRPFCAETDLPYYHRWMNEAYARPFWQLHGPLANLETHYLSLQAGADTAVYTGLLDGEPIFTLEPYWAPGDLVGRYYDAQPGDYGLHLLLAPASQPRPRFSRHVLLLCLEFLFADPRVTRVICEADRHNAGMARLLARAHFQFQHYVQLPDKEASLTTCTRADMARLAADLRQPAPALA